MVKEHPPFDEARTIELLSRGDEQAFVRVFDQYRKRIFGVAMTLLKSEEQAKEVVQEVFLKVWTKRDELANVQSLENFLFIMARNMILNDLKRQVLDRNAKSEFSHNSNQVNNADWSIREQQCEDLLSEVINRLPPQQQLVYRMAKVDGMSYDGIARQLNISRFTVRNHMAEALRSIRLTIHQHLGMVVLFLALLPIF